MFEKTENGAANPPTATKVLSVCTGNLMDVHLQALQERAPSVVIRWFVPAPSGCSIATRYSFSAIFRRGWYRLNTCTGYGSWISTYRGYRFLLSLIVITVASGAELNVVAFARVMLSQSQCVFYIRLNVGAMQTCQGLQTQLRISAPVICSYIIIVGK